MQSLLLLLIPAADISVAARIDDFAAKHWQASRIRPAELTSDLAFLRRLTLDLAGRIPTVGEAKAFAADTAPDRRSRASKRLMDSPEYPLHLGRILDEILQDKYAGDGEFLEYLRAAVAKKKPWNEVFRDVVLGPWEGERKGASQFLLRRIRNLDEVTTDTSRVFFGVNVSCAQCHDHPLVSDWKQDHYFGMASFFNRTAGKGGKGGTGAVEEKTAGEVMFLTTKGERKTAKMMFLSSQTIDEEQVKKAGKGPFSRREQLVNTALQEKGFLSRAIVNQLWNFYMGRGLVHPVDQMHSANPSSVPGVLEWLGEDFAANGYNVDRLVSGIVSSRIYQLSSVPGQGGKAPSDRDFARAALRPLTPNQLAVSLLVATGEANVNASKEARTLEREASRFVKSKLIDPRSDRYQSSAVEALYLTNHPEVQRLVEPVKNNLTGRLVALNTSKEIVETAVWTILSRPPDAEELTFLSRWVESKPERALGCRQLVWALMTSGEFRFNH